MYYKGMVGKIIQHMAYLKNKSLCFLKAFIQKIYLPKFDLDLRGFISLLFKAMISMMYIIFSYAFFIWKMLKGLGFMVTYRDGLLGKPYSRAYYEATLRNARVAISCSIVNTFVKPSKLFPCIIQPLECLMIFMQW